jgi:hypothetical protein
MEELIWKVKRLIGKMGLKRFIVLLDTTYYLKL